MHHYHILTHYKIKSQIISNTKDGRNTAALQFTCGLWDPSPKALSLLPKQGMKLISLLLVDGTLVTHVDTVQELPDILVLHMTFLCRKTFWH
jgi:hypothetical protein